MHKLMDKQIENEQGVDGFMRSIFFLNGVVESSLIFEGACSAWHYGF